MKQEIDSDTKQTSERTRTHTCTGTSKMALERAFIDNLSGVLP